MNERLKVLIGGSLFLLVVYVFSTTLYTEIKLQQAIQSELATQEDVLLATAMIIDRDGATATVEAIVSDCSIAAREKFDTLLATLSSLSPSELREIQQLFLNCGDYYAVRRALMVDTLEHQYNLYATLKRLQTEGTFFKNSEGDDATKWSDLVLYEKKRAALTKQLTSIQGAIIDSLINTDDSSATTDALVEEADTVKKELLQIGTTVDSLRQEIISV